MNTRAKAPSESEFALFDEAIEHVDLSIESGTTYDQRPPRSGHAYGQVITLPFAPGDVIADKYQVVGLMGVGGVAFVVSALHIDLGEMRALKFLRPESLEHDEDVARFSREARSAARIKSEHVCRVFDVGTLPEAGPFIVMEYLEGKDLSDILREQGRLPLKVAVDYVLQTCEALASAHAADIVHRDIKPENLFLTEPASGISVIKVLDFGISKNVLGARARAEHHLSGKAALLPMGTPAYMSPEQVRAAGDVDARADIWALGCVLYELLTGSCAFDGPTLMQLGAAILEREPVPLRNLLPEAPEGLQDIVERCLNKDPELRYQSVAELAAELCPYAPRRSRIYAERCAKILGVDVLIEVSARSLVPPSMASAPASRLNLLEAISQSLPPSLATAGQEPLVPLASPAPHPAPEPETPPKAPELAPRLAKSRSQWLLTLALSASLGTVAGAGAWRLNTQLGWYRVAAAVPMRPRVKVTSPPRRVQPSFPPSPQACLPSAQACLLREPLEHSACF